MVAKRQRGSFCGLIIKVGGDWNGDEPGSLTAGNRYCTGCASVIRAVRCTIRGTCAGRVFNRDVTDRGLVQGHGESCRPIGLAHCLVGYADKWITINNHQISGGGIACNRRIGRII